MLRLAPLAHGHIRIAQTEQRAWTVKVTALSMSHRLLIEDLSLLIPALLKVQIPNPPLCSPSIDRLRMVSHEFLVLLDSQRATLA